MIGAGADAFPAAKIPDGRIAPETFQYDADLLFGGELAAGKTFDVPDKSLRFFSPGFACQNFSDVC